MADLLDTVVRFHDVNRLPELRHCVFSLVGQSYRPLRIILAVQRFSDADIATVRQELAPLLAGPDAPELAFVNWTDEKPRDARSVLLNLGVAAARGRYLAFLDYDDVLYPEAYTMMVDRLAQTGAVIAFSSVRVLRVDVYDQFMYAAGTVIPAFGSGASLLDLFRNNFCPLHSYVMDRSAIPATSLTFKTDLLFEEDYDVLLRICAEKPADFALVNTRIGDYYFKTDGSNTVPADGRVPGSEHRYQGVREAIEERKRKTMVPPPILASLGLPADIGPLSIRQVLDKFGVPLRSHA